MYIGQYDRVEYFITPSIDIIFPRILVYLLSHKYNTKAPFPALIKQPHPFFLHFFNILVTSYYSQLTILLSFLNQSQYYQQMERKLPIEDLKSDKELIRTLNTNFGNVIVFFFYARTNKQAMDLLTRFQISIPVFGVYDNVKYYGVSIQKCPQTFNKFDIDVAPTIIITETSKKIALKHEEDEIGTFFDTLSTVSAQKKEQYEKLKPIFMKKCDDLVKLSPLMIFMKGTPKIPKCGFVRQLLGVLENNKVEFAYYDIDYDQEMRHWVKVYSGRQTFPQIFIEGKLFGGLDDFKEVVEKGELQNTLPSNCFKASAAERLEKYLNIHKDEKTLFINSFPFQNEESQKLVQSMKIKDPNILIWNIGFDLKMKGAVQEKFKKTVPFTIEKNAVIE